MERFMRQNCKKQISKKSQYFPKPFKSFGGNINVKLGLSNYATKTDVKNVTHVDTSSFTVKTNLDSLKAEVAKLGQTNLISRFTGKTWKKVGSGRHNKNKNIVNFYNRITQILKVF